MTDAGDLGRGRECYARQAWLASFEALSRADRAAPLGAEDLELLARSAYMLGRDEEYVDGLSVPTAPTRARRGPRRRPLRVLDRPQLLFRGEGPRASGWFARAQRLLEDGRGTASSAATC